MEFPYAELPPHVSWKGYIMQIPVIGLRWDGPAFYSVVSGEMTTRVAFGDKSVLTGSCFTPMLVDL